MLLAQGQIYAKNMAFYVPTDCVRFARYCGKMYSHHLFPNGGLYHWVERDSVKLSFLSKETTE